MGKSVKRFTKAVFTGGLSEVADAVRAPAKAAENAAKMQAAATRRAADDAARAQQQQAAAAQAQQETLVAQKRASEAAGELLMEGEDGEEADVSLSGNDTSAASVRKRRNAFQGRYSSGVNI